MLFNWDIYLKCGFLPFFFLFIDLVENKTQILKCLRNLLLPKS